MGAHGNAEGVSRGSQGMPEVVQTLDEATITRVKPSGLNLADSVQYSQALVSSEVE